MKVSEVLLKRGFVSQFSAESLAEVVDGESRVVYHGIDPTADSAHVGNFVVWMLLRHLAQAGHKIIFLVGGGTGMIGDPKPDAERQLARLEEIQERVVTLRQQAETILGVDSIQFINNYDWLSKLELLGFLRDVGKHFTVNELIKKDAIARRLESETGLSYTEFAYPLLQAYDYLHLYRTALCTLQVGGSDQWGNIIAGVDLVRRVEQATVHALTVPLVIDKTTGKKFGKSEGNAVWLSAEKTTPYAFYQFWLNVADENVIDYLRLFTTVSLEEIAALEKDLQINSGSRAAQKHLAQAVTAIVHGEGVARMMERVSACLFGETPVSLLSKEEQALLLEHAPSVEFSASTPLVDVLVDTGLATSKREARTFIESGAVLVQGAKVTDVRYECSKAGDGELVHLKRGKKQVALAVFLH